MLIYSSYISPCLTFLCEPFFTLDLGKQSETWRKNKKQGVNMLSVRGARWTDSGGRGYKWGIKKKKNDIQERNFFGANHCTSFGFLLFVPWGRVRVCRGLGLCEQIFVDSRPVSIQFEAIKYLVLLASQKGSNCSVSLARLPHEAGCNLCGLAKP